MVELLVISSAAVATIGVVVIVWSIIDTRKQYYKEFVSRRNRNAGD